MQSDILKARNEIIAQFGEWTAHNIQLAPGVSTMDGRIDQQWRVQWFDKLMRRLGGSLLSRQLNRFARGTVLDGVASTLFYKSRRILDLACLEGLFTIAFARRGATTVGLEIRNIHLAKANFAKDCLRLPNATFVMGDVRFIPEDLGQFDVIICAGILYHLDFPDCVEFLKAMGRRSRDLVIIDSHLAYPQITESVLPLSEMRRYAVGDEAYSGRQIVEHMEGASTDEKETVNLWASIDNDLSVWLAEPDVCRIMKSVGFELVFKGFPNEGYEANNPDRPTLVFKRR